MPDPRVEGKGSLLHIFMAPNKHSLFRPSGGLDSGRDGNRAENERQVALESGEERLAGYSHWLLPGTIQYGALGRRNGSMR